MPWLVPTGRPRLVAAVLAGSVGAGALAAIGVDRLTALPENAVLAVADTVVTREAFQQQVDLLEALYGVRPPADGPALGRFQRDAAKALAVSLIVDRAAAEQGVAVTEGTARDALHKIIEEKFGSNREGFGQALGTLGVSEAAVQREIGRQLTASQAFQRVTANVAPVTDEQLSQTYRDRAREMVMPEQRHLRYVVVEVEQNAQNVLARMRAGEDFGKLAAEFSIDESTKNRAGDLGVVAEARLEKEFGGAAFGTPAGSFFGPVKSRFGWNLGQVLEVQPAQQLTFEQVKQRLRAQLESERRFEAWRVWLGERIRAAEVRYADSYRPEDPDAPPPARQR